MVISTCLQIRDVDTRFKRAPVDQRKGSCIVHAPCIKEELLSHTDVFVKCRTRDLVPVEIVRKESKVEVGDAVMEVDELEIVEGEVAVR